MKIRGYVTCQVCNRSEVFCHEIDGLVVCESPECRIFCPECGDAIVDEPGKWCEFCLTDAVKGTMNIYRAAIVDRIGGAR